MEAARSTRKRKPLADRTNTTTTTTTTFTSLTRSSPSLHKLPPPPPSTAADRNKSCNQNKQPLASASSIETRNKRRRKLAEATAASTSVDNDDANKENVPADITREDNVDIIPDLLSSPTTPAVRHQLSPQAEPLTVYARRQTVKKKGKEKVISEAFTCLPVERKCRKESKVSKCLTELPKKRRTKERVVSKDYFEQQRAYFAEIDKCELPEEEVSESELSDH